MSSVDDKIRKLLAIAECESATDAERELALEKAAALADRHAVDMASLGSAADSFGTTVVYLARSRPAWVLPVTVVLQLFNVRAVFSTVNTEHGRFKTVSLFGSQSSRQVGEYVFTFLRREFLRRCSLYEAELKAKAVACRLVTNDWRMSSAWKGEYYRGLAAGTHMSGVLGFDGSKWAWVEGERMFCMYGSVSLANGIVEYLNAHGVPGE